MKRNIIYFVAVLISCGAFMNMGCSKFGDTNVNPNAGTLPVTSALLTNVESNLATEPSTSNTAYYVQYFSQVQYPDNHLYAVTTVSWDTYYRGVLFDLQNIINTCSEHPDPISLGGNTKNQIQIARILKAYYFSVLTDRYGDIPYSASLKGAPKVAYDKQSDIYSDLFAELKTATDAFENSGNPIKGDIIFGGDISKWKKFANSLRLILAMRLSKVDPVKGKAEFLAALAEPSGFIDNNQYNFVLNYPGGSFNNPWYNLTGASELAITQTIADKLNAYGDPRVFAYGHRNANNLVKGVPYGLNRDHLQAWFVNNTDWSRVFDPAWKRNNSPVCIIPASYIDLLRAEAAIVYNSGEDAFTLLKKGISDSWSQWNVTGDIDTYLASIGVSAGNVTAAKIQEQTWIALYGNSQNAWNEWRRTGIPALTPAPDAVNASQKIPRRYAYPSTEGSINKEAYNAAVSAFPYGSGDDHDNRVWWDKP